ncbi:MAG: hypothetical protein K2Q22_00480, partial [Cytophagales bacterium]|nr:hypothetical protein [Cytophagales bacterium]
TIDEKPRKLFDLEFSGYVRLHTYYRVMQENYAGDPKKVFQFGGWANQTQTNQLNPLVYLTAKLRPTNNSFIEIDYTFNHLFTGNLGDSSRYINAFRLVRAQAGINTKYFNLRLGTAGAFGFPVILSPMTSGFLQFKFPAFYRLPWDWYRSPGTKYNDIFYNQSIGLNQLFSGVGGVQGVSAEFSNLPWNLGVNFLYGVFNQTSSATIANTGNNNTLGSAKTSFGFRVYKKFGDNNQIGINWLENNGPIDGSSNKTEYQTIRTVDAQINTSWFTLNPEVGVGWYVNPLGKWRDTTNVATREGYNSGINWLVNVKFATKESATYFPLRFQYYSIGKDITNLNSGIVNTYGHNNASDFKSTNVLYDVNMYRALITEVDQVANNRQGVMFATEKVWKNFRLGLGLNSSIEIENRYNMVTFMHRVNQYARSSFRFFESYSGPYNRLQYFFMRTFEFLQITDVNPTYRKGFNVLDLDLKFRTKLAGKDLIFTNFTNYSSASDGFRAVPDFSDNAFVKVVYNDFMIYYLLHEKVGINGHFGLEAAQGGMRTELADANGNRIVDANGNAKYDPTGKPISQLGIGLGAGVDYHFSDWGGIFLRYLWMSQRDLNFSKDKFRGNEFTVELKVFF